jgi:hypothetical protein
MTHERLVVFLSVIEYGHMGSGSEPSPKHDGRRFATEQNKHG